MAIASCRQCGKTVTTQAMVCPHCGAANPTPSTIFLSPRQTPKWFTWVFLLVVVLILVT